MLTIIIFLHQCILIEHILSTRPMLQPHTPLNNLIEQSRRQCLNVISGVLSNKIHVEVNCLV